MYVPPYLLLLGNVFVLILYGKNLPFGGVTDVCVKA